MKKSLTILLAALLFAACGGPSKENARKYITQEVKEGNEQMPEQDTSQAITCTGILFCNDNVHYNYIINEKYTSIGTFRKSKKTLRKDIESTVRSAAELRAMIESLNVLEGKMIYTYKGSVSGDTVCIVLEAKEMM